MKCLLCGEHVKYDDEELLWGHIQLEHPDKFEEVEDWETLELCR